MFQSSVFFTLSARPSAVWRGPTISLRSTGRFSITWVWFIWPCSSTPQRFTFWAPPSICGRAWVSSTCCWQVNTHTHVQYCQPRFFLFDSIRFLFAFWHSVALTNLDDADNARRSYEQAVQIDEYVCLRAEWCESDECRSVDKVTSECHLRQVRPAGEP